MRADGPHASEGRGVTARGGTTGPLQGIRIVDITTAFSGPYCSLLLAEMGADVIKVEAPGGDVIRDVGARRTPGMSGTFLNANRGKRSVVLDLKTPGGRQILDELVGSADVLLHNMRPAAADRLGLAYQTVADRHPNLVYCGLHGYGEGGPYADRPAYDDTIQAASGLAHLQGLGTGEPAYARTIVVDKTAGLTALYGILAALFFRERTGSGQEVDVSMFEMMVSYVLIEHMNGWTFDPPVGPPIYPRTVSEHRRPYRTSDGYVAVMLYTDAHWRRFFASQGMALMDEPRFASIGGRTEHIDELYGIVREIMLTRTTAEWHVLLEDIDVPMAPVHDFESLLTDPHLLSTGFFRTHQHPTEGPLRSMRAPVAFSATREGNPRPAPHLGEHTAEVLRELGLSQERIEQLYADGSALGLRETAVPGRRTG